MENNNSNDFFGISEYPKEFLSGLTPEGIERVPDLANQYYGSVGVSNLDVRGNTISKMAERIKAREVALNKKIMAYMMAGSLLVSAGMAALYSNADKIPIGYSSSNAQTADENELKDISVFGDVNQEYLREMNELSEIVTSYRNEATVENRAAAVNAARRYKDVALRFLGSNYGYDRLSYRANSDDGLVVVGVSENGELFEFNGPLYVTSAVGAASALDMYSGDGRSEKWDGAIDQFLSKYDTISSAVSRVCDEKIQANDEISSSNKL